MCTIFLIPRVCWVVWETLLLYGLVEYGVNKHLLCVAQGAMYLLQNQCVTVNHRNLCGLEQLAFIAHMSEWPSRQLC